MIDRCEEPDSTMKTLEQEGMNYALCRGPDFSFYAESRAASP